MLVNAEEVIEEIDDSASESSNIDMHVQLSAKAAVRNPRSVLGQLTSSPSTYETEFYDESADDTSNTPSFDGGLEPKDIDSAAGSAAAVNSLKTLGFLSRLSATVSNGLRGLVYRSRMSLFMLTSASQEKRERDENLTNGDDTTQKRPWLGIERQPLNCQNVAVVIKSEPLQCLAVVKGTRHTRHSGLEVACQPMKWNKKPEHEHSTEERSMREATQAVQFW